MVLALVGRGATVAERTVDKSAPGILTGRGVPSTLGRLNVGQSRTEVNAPGGGVRILGTLLSYRRLPKANASHMRQYTRVAAALLTVALASPAAGQDKPFGITFGYPASIGALWQVRERVALRPEFTIGYSNETDPDISLTAHGWRFGIATSAVLSLYRDKPRHLYAVPYYEFRRRNAAFSQSMSYAPDPLEPQRSELTTLEVNTRTNDHTIAGLIGIAFDVSDRSAVFAEVGPAYRQSIRRAAPLPELPLIHSPISFSDDTLNTTENSIRAVGRVGVTVRF